jgi:hypothetical protein
MVSPEPYSQPAPQPQEPYKLRATLSKAAVLSIVVVGLIAGGMYFTSGTALLAESHTDNVSDAEQLARIKAFDSLKDFPVAIVSPADVTAAVESMHLAPSARDALLVRLGAHSEQRVAVASSPASSARPARQVNGAAPDAQAEPSPAPRRHRRTRAPKARRQRFASPGLRSGIRMSKMAMPSGSIVKGIQGPWYWRTTV